MTGRAPLLAAALVLALGLTGCAGGESYSTQTASQLQHAVLDVATSSAGDDYAGALAKLTALEQLNDAAVKKGSISAARHDAIAASITAIRADLGRLQDAAEKAQLQQQIQQLQQQQQQQQEQPKGPDKKDDKGGKGKKGGGD
ncbi:hypothetical protein A0130_10115 [Leifsonia xyli]|uniref:hypothetical protein n=1 Tax=Leifsonia xyli TaxID=1575 RepID=UPI0007CE0048|nr:hypothetical protein A0130_10115 [Leifsonia xyli]